MHIEFVKNYWKSKQIRLNNVPPDEKSKSILMDEFEVFLPPDRKSVNNEKTNWTTKGMKELIMRKKKKLCHRA